MHPPMCWWTGSRNMRSFGRPIARSRWKRPPLTADPLARFAEDVLAERWQGNKAVWIAPEDAGGELTPFPAGYDHLRAIPVQDRPNE